jgi:hypothetical protein
MIVVIIHRVTDPLAGSDADAPKTGKNSAARIFGRRNRPKPAREPKLFCSRIVQPEQPIAGLKNID